MSACEYVRVARPIYDETSACVGDLRWWMWVGRFSRRRIAKPGWESLPLGAVERWGDPVEVRWTDPTAIGHTSRGVHRGSTWRTAGRGGDCSVNFILPQLRGRQGERTSLAPRPRRPTFLSAFERERARRRIARARDLPRGEAREINGYEEGVVERNRER